MTLPTLYEAKHSLDIRFISSQVFRELLDKLDFDSDSDSDSSSTWSRSPSVDNNDDKIEIGRSSMIKRVSTIRRKEGELDSGLEHLNNLNRQKGNSFLRSMSENSETSDMDEKETVIHMVAQNHVVQILDEIIENVLTIEELKLI